MRQTKINNTLLEEARRIRLDFINCNNNLTLYQEDILNLSKALTEAISKLDEIKKENVAKKADATEKHFIDFRDKMIKIMDDLSIEEQRLTSKISKMNVGIENAQRQEVILYEKIKKEYPDFSDEAIVEQIRQYIIGNETL
jgi:arsenate reductase-like glutaredoxin family protein